MKVDVILVAKDATSQSVQGKTAVVVDVLRATSTMSTALQNGALAIHAVTSPERAFELAGEFERAKVLIGGERGGIKVEGFDLGNSPREYTQDTVSGKTIIMTTSNGTLAINNSSAADNLYICSLLNGSAAARAASQNNQDVVVVCSGGGGHYTLEDAFCAGMVVDYLASDGCRDLSDLAITCRSLFLQYRHDPLLLLETAFHGRYLKTIGFAEDLEYCSRLDSLSVVATVENGVITADWR